jgi:amino acid permease
VQVLAGGVVAFVVALCFFGIVWMRMESLLRAYPLLGIPFVLSMILAPSMLFISVRRIAEIGLRSRLLLSTLLSATAIGLTALTFILSLQHLAGR